MNPQKHLDIALVYPFLGKASWKNALRSKDNLGLGYLSACLRKNGYTSEMLNAEHLELPNSETCAWILKHKPSVVGLSCTAQRSYEECKKIAEQVKATHDCKIIIGGIFPTVAHKEILEDSDAFDAVCRGEGEELIIEFMRSHLYVENWNSILGLTFRSANRNIIINANRPPIHDLDTIPFPDKTLLTCMKNYLDSGLYYVNISAGRGCFGKCSFCSTTQLFGRTERRARTPENVLDEIENCIETYKVNYFKFIDEIFVFPNNEDWINRFCTGIKERGLCFRFHIELRADCVDERMIRQLSEVGLDEVFVGVESGDDAVLARFNKGTTVEQNNSAINILEEYGVKIQLGFIMFEPELTHKELRANILWLLGSKIYSHHNLYNKLNIYYGSPLEQRLQQNGLFAEASIYKRHAYRYRDPIVSNMVELVDWAKGLYQPIFRTVNSNIRSTAANGEKGIGWQETLKAIDNHLRLTWRKLLLSAYVAAKNPSKKERYKELAGNCMMQSNLYVKKEIESCQR